MNNEHIGCQIGRWTIIGQPVKYGKSFIKIPCRCTCGTEKQVSRAILRNGQSKSCGCLKSEKSKDHWRSALIGKKFGNLTVVNYEGKRFRESLWECKCDCGKTVLAITYRLQSGHTHSCGCLRHKAGNKSPLWRGHGEISLKYWYQIKRAARIRGLDFSITIEHAWDILQKQNKKCALTGLPIDPTHSTAKAKTASLDRIDSSLGYLAGNIQWVDKRVNMMKGTLTQPDFIALCRLVSEKGPTQAAHTHS